jgi:hypothetical protein
MRSPWRAHHRIPEQVGTAQMRLLPTLRAFAIPAVGCYGEAMSARRIIIGISGPASA